MRKLLWFPAILGLGLFFRNKGRVADLIDTGEWTLALIYIAFAIGGVACALTAMSSSEGRMEQPSTESVDSPTTEQSEKEKS